MQMSRMVLTVKTDQLRSQFEDLEREIAALESTETTSLRILVRLKIQEAELLNLSLAETQYVTGTPEQTKFEENYRGLKKDYHTAIIRWRQIQSRNSRQRQHAA